MTEPNATSIHHRTWLPTALRGLLVLFLLYLFLVGIGFLELGIASAGAGFQEGMLESVSHPISGLCAGILFTVLVQSSSVSTSTVVGMVGAGTLPLSLAVPIVMGANVGTTVTNTLASMGSIRRAPEFRRAFAAATMHDFFNLTAVAILLPVELATGFLQNSASWLTEILRGREFNPSEPGTSPIRAAVKLPIEWVEGMVEPGRFLGLFLLLVGLALLYLALSQITRNMRRLVAGGVERVMNRVLGGGGGLLGIVVGIAITIAVQSSSITTSILVPLTAAGVLTVRTAYPITLGANVGTTVTALIASLAVLRPEGLTIALVHTLFNLTALAIIYPVPWVRHFPVGMADRIAEFASGRHAVIFGYSVGLFVVLPLIGLFVIR